MLNSILGTELTLTSFLICTGVSLLLGVGTALVAGYRGRSTQSLAVTLAILPAEDVETLLAELRRAKAGGKRVAFGPNIRPRLWDDELAAAYFQLRFSFRCEAAQSRRYKLMRL